MTTRSMMQLGEQPAHDHGIGGMLTTISVGRGKVTPSAKPRGRPEGSGIAGLALRTRAIAAWTSLHERRANGRGAWRGRASVSWKQVPSSNRLASPDPAHM